MASDTATTTAVPVRSTIEAHGRTGALEGLGEPMACGPIFGEGNSPWDCTLAVAVDGRWD